MNKVLTKYIFLATVLLISSAAMAQRETGTPNGTNASTRHVTIGGSVFGGGNLAPVAGNTEVKINQRGATVEEDVYGGGALANVGTDNNNTTTVELLDGIVNRNVYGGGLGDSIGNGYFGESNIAALVFGKVYVYVGKAPENPNDPSSEPTGHITINGDVFGCNNINGTPKDDVFVGVYRTAHTGGDNNNQYPLGVVMTLDDLDVLNPDDVNYNKKFAINAVYGGGNKASYIPDAVASGTTPHSTTVYVWGCTENTVKTVYGGGNAANVGTSTITANTNILIDGGRFDRIFGGGNGYSASYNHDKPYKDGDDCTETETNAPCEDYNPGANIYGAATTTINGGLFRQVFGGSNQYGNLNSVSLNIEKLCDTLLIYETFGGGNEADIAGNLTTTLGCSNYTIGNFYGGSNLADIDGDVTLNVRGGNYVNVFGGSKGRLANTSVTPEITEKSANISGNVTLNLNGGTMVNAFGGCNIKGSIGGYITVNLLDTVTTCPLQVDTIYGGGRDAEYAPDSISGKKIISPVVNLLHGMVGHYEGQNIVHGCVFGGGKGETAVVKAHPKVIIGDTITTGPDAIIHQNYQVTVLGSTIGGGNVFGGGNAAEVDGIDSVLMLKANNRVVNLFGGGNEAIADTAVVIMTAGTVDTIFGGGNLAGLYGPTLVKVSSGTVQGGIYGGSNKSGIVEGDITVDVLGGQIGRNHIARANVHGGGYGNGTSTNSHVVVNIDGATVYGDVYGGSGYGDVNAGNDTTMVNVLSGTIYGDVYGGGLGNKNPNYAAKVKGKVYVNIGKEENGNYVGNANISTYTVNSVEYGGNVFGCNNANGSPQDSVFVNIYHTAHGDTPQTNAYPTTPPTGSTWTLESLNINAYGNASYLPQTYAIKAVYGGGNEAAYTPTLTDDNKPKSATVHVYGCQNNTIKEVYGGGNAANVGTNGEGGISANTFIFIDGGRINRVFGGGRGDNTSDIAANIYGTATTNIYAGLIDTIFGGGNMRGDIDSISLILAHNMTCADELFNQVFGGANLAALSGSLNTTINCGVEQIGDIYGGSNLANIGGDVTLNIKGGRYNTVFGGSKGKNDVPANIAGKVELNLNGGKMVNAFGGSNVKGNIGGSITVNVLNQGGDCGLQVDTIYGGGQEASYTPINNRSAYPLVNLMHGTVGHTTGGVTTPGCVFGGGKGIGATVNANPKVIIGDDDSDHEAIVLGNVFGGGNLAAVNGIDSVLMQNSNSRADTIFGGGNLANVSGSNVVDINGGTVNHDVYGGGALANTGGSKVTLAGGTVTHDIYGGGLGDDTHPAALNGAVQVTVNSGTVGGDVYGCNNINGAPQSTSTVKVDIYDATPAAGATYAISNVFGGGNMAAFGGTSEVTIHNCDNSIEYVYGGGNKASVGGTKVDVYGGNTIGNVFAGGNGEGLDYTYTMVTGNAQANIYGGTIGKVFGGNNNRGVINGPTIEVNVDKQTESGEGHTSCPMYIGEVYGGGNLAHGKAAKITIGCTGDIVDGTNGHIAHHERIGTTLEGIGTVYGGANEANIFESSDDIVLDINSGIIDTVFGGNNKSGTIGVDIQVNIDSTGTCSPNWYVGEVYGGGNHAAYSGIPDVNIKKGTVYRNVFGGGNDITLDTPDSPTLGVGGSDVVMTGGTVLLGVYGGCNAKGSVMGSSMVKIHGGTVGSQQLLSASTPTVAQVFGGGLGEPTRVTGNVTVEVKQGDEATVAPIIWGDVYGGSALGNVNTNSTNTTTVTILDGALKSNKQVGGTTSSGQTYYNYYGGNVYGGGLGEKIGVDGGTTDIAAKVNGVVFVNIGAPARSGRDLNPEEDENIGTATIEGNVYGCNNTNGSPQDSVTVHIYRTHRDATEEVTYREDDATFAIDNVFGGGNRADYKPAVSGRKLKVLIHGCYNTIERVFGASNAAAAGNSGTSVVVNTIIDGGRFDHVFGGGNGEVQAADIFGDVDLEIHGGYVNEFYVGSNQQGSISGASDVLVDQSSGCEEIDITEFFCGGKYADFVGDINVTIHCSDGMHVTNLYGGCKEANVVAGNGGHGNIHLVVEGGTYDNIYGGSKGYIDPNNHANDISADIEGNVLLEVFGGTVINAIYGGCNVKGDIAGKIIVNVEEGGNEGCALDVSIAEVYGGGNKADYNTTSHAEHDYPQVNIRNATVKNVFGGGYQAKVTGNPKIKIKKGSKILGNVYGGGNMGEVDGSPKVTIDGKDDSESPHTVE